MSEPSKENAGTLLTNAGGSLKSSGQMIRESVVGEGGTVAPVPQGPIPGWVNGASAKKPRRKVPRTAQIKGATRDALADQFAAAADEVIRLRLALRNTGIGLLCALAAAVFAIGSRVIGA